MIIHTIATGIYNDKEIINSVADGTVVTGICVTDSPIVHGTVSLLCERFNTKFPYR